MDGLNIFLNHKSVVYFLPQRTQRRDGSIFSWLIFRARARVRARARIFREKVKNNISGTGTHTGTGTKKMHKTVEC